MCRKTLISFLLNAQHWRKTRSKALQHKLNPKKSRHFNVSFRGYLNPSTGWVTWASRSSPTTLSLSFEKSLTAWFTYKQIIAVRIIKPYQNTRRRFSFHITSGKERKPLGTRFSKRITIRPGFSCCSHLVIIHPRESEPANLRMTHHISYYHGIQTSKGEVQSGTTYKHMLVHE